MNKRQKSKLASFIAVEAVLQADPEIASVPGLPERLAVLSAKVGEISSLAIRQTQPTEAGTLSRDQRLSSMVEMALSIAGIIRTMARAQNLQDLGRTVKVAAGAFRRFNPFDRVWLAQRIHDAGQSVVSPLSAYGVTVEVLATLQARIDAAREALEQPRVSVVARRVATERIEVLVREGASLLQEEIDRLVFPLRDSRPEFYARYRAARSVVDLPGNREKDEEESAPASALETLPTATQDEAAA
jgi:hypothetical protein